MDRVLPRNRGVQQLVAEQPALVTPDRQLEDFEALYTRTFPRVYAYAASLLRDTPGDLIIDMNEGRQRVETRFEVLIEELDCNPNRLRGWAFATAVDQAVWCAENGDHANAAAIVETARMIRALEV